jgi:hypothetical protein
MKQIIKNQENCLSSIRRIFIPQRRKFVGSKFPSPGGVAKIQRIFDGVVKVNY